MSDEPVVIQFSWEDPVNGKSHLSSYRAPIAIGRESTQMPAFLGSQPMSHLELVHKQVSRYHALITVANRQLHITDKSANGTFLNGRRVPQGRQVFTSKDTLRIGPFKITATILNTDETSSTELNPEHQQLAKPLVSANPNAILIWLVGGVILLLIGVGIWAGAQVLLNRARPNVNPTSPESSLDISGIEVGRLETITTTAWG